MSSRIFALFIAGLLGATPALAQGAGGGGGGAGGAASSGSAGQTAVSQESASGNASNQQAGANNSSSPSAVAVHTAVTGANTKPSDQAPGAVSAPGVGVGHAANGVPIGEPGSGLGSPERPVDGKTMTR